LHYLEERQAGNLCQINDRFGNLHSFFKVSVPKKPYGELKTSQKSWLNAQALDFLSIQAGGDERARLESLVHARPMREAAISSLNIDLRFDPIKARSIMSQGNFTHEQLRLLRKIGVKLPNFYSLQEETERLMFKYELGSAEFTVKGPNDSSEVGKDPNFPFLYFISFHSKQNKSPSFKQKLETLPFIRATSLKEPMEKLLEIHPPNPKRNILNHIKVEKDSRNMVYLYLELCDHLESLQKALQEPEMKPLQNILEKAVENRFLSFTLLAGRKLTSFLPKDPLS